MKSRIRPFNKCTNVQELFDQASAAGFFMRPDSIRTVACRVDNAVHLVAFGDEQDFGELVQSIGNSLISAAWGGACAVEVREI